MTQALKYMAPFILLESDHFRESILRILRILSLRYYSIHVLASAPLHVKSTQEC